jgi:hypothetical protein
MRRVWRTLAFIFTAVGPMGLVKNLVALSPDLSLASQGWPFWWPASAIPLGLFFWWLSWWQGKKDHAALAEQLPRRLTSEQRGQIVRALRGTKRTAYVCADVMAFDSTTFGKDISDALNDGGWQSQCEPTRSFAVRPPLVVCASPNEATTAQKAAGAALASAGLEFEWESDDVAKEQGVDVMIVVSPRKP